MAVLDILLPDLGQPEFSDRNNTSGGHHEPPRATLVSLARTIHDTAIQRLCGVSLLLSSSSALSGEHQSVCRDEIASALLELREAIGSSLSNQDLADRLSSQHELASLRSKHAPAVRFSEDDLPTLTDEIAELIDTALAEAFRNVNKHSLPQSVDVRLESSGELLTLSVRNDGAGGSNPGPPGLGIRLLQIDAASVGGIVECQRAEPDLWTLRMTLPLAS